jgi:hypothetical protein
MTNRDGHLPPDEQSERTRWELWAILIIVAVVLIGSFAWRAFGHHPAARDTAAWRFDNQNSTATTRIVATPAAVSPPHAR